MTTAPMIGALPTAYKGIKFRSRIEARWAVFFDALAIPWEYEPEGYALASGRYLPDFWLPDQDCFWEVKGAAPTEAEQEKARELANLTGRRVCIAFGPIGDPDVLNNCNECRNNSDPESTIVLFPDDGWDSRYWWCQCGCGRFGIEFEGRGERVCDRFGQGCLFMPKPWMPLHDAFVEAKNFRFWDPK